MRILVICGLLLLAGCTAMRSQPYIRMQAEECLVIREKQAIFSIGPCKIERTYIK